MHVKALEWKGLMTRRHAPNAIVDASSGDGEHQERSRLREVADELLQRKLAVSETRSCNDEKQRATAMRSCKSKV
jgi:hypothetical protein